MKLRKFTIQDANRVASLVGDESVSKWTLNIPFPYSELDAIDWINNSAKSPDRHPFAVEIGDEIVACVSFWPYDENTNEVGYWVGKSYLFIEPQYNKAFKYARFARRMRQAAPLN